MAKPKPQTVQHKSVIVKAPVGTRFTLWGSDLLLEYERGKSRDVANAIVKWAKETLIPEAIREESGADSNDANPEITKLKNMIADLEADDERKRQEAAAEKEAAARIAKDVLEGDDTNTSI